MECWLAWLFFICVVVFVLDIGRLILSDSVCFALYFLTYWVLYACFSLLDFSFVWLISLFWWFAYDCALSISYACVFCWIFNILHKFCMFNFACLVLVVGSECLFLYIYIVGFAFWSGHQCVCCLLVEFCTLHFVRLFWWVWETAQQMLHSWLFTFSLLCFFTETCYGCCLLFCLSVG